MEYAVVTGTTLSPYSGEGEADKDNEPNSRFVMQLVRVSFLSIGAHADGIRVFDFGSASRSVFEDVVASEQHHASLSFSLALDFPVGDVSYFIHSSLRSSGAASLPTTRLQPLAS